MRNNEKNIETKLPQLGIIIKFGGWLVLFIVLSGLIYACGATISTAVVIYLGYKVLRLILRFFRLVISIFFTVVSIVVFAIIISLLIF